MFISAQDSVFFGVIQVLLRSRDIFAGVLGFTADIRQWRGGGVFSMVTAPSVFM